MKLKCKCKKPLNFKFEMQNDAIEFYSTIIGTNTKISSSIFRNSASNLCISFCVYIYHIYTFDRIMNDTIMKRKVYYFYLIMYFTCV